MRVAILVVLLAGCASPRIPAPDVSEFLPTEVVYRPRLALECRRPLAAAVGPIGARANWDGPNGDIDESGRIMAWLESIDSATPVRARHYTLHVDDIESGSHLHAISLPTLPGLVPEGVCDAWLKSAEATASRRAIEQVEQILSRYTWRRLHRPFSMENEAPPETERQTAVELLRRRSDPNGDWPASPSDRDDEASRAGAVFLMSTARSPEYGPPLTSNPLTVALRCSGSWRHDLECAGAEDLVVFRSRTREVRLSRHLATPPMESVLCRAGHITTIAGMSPRRRLVVLSDYEGIFAQEGEDTQDANCTGLAAARTHTVLRFDP